MENKNLVVSLLAIIIGASGLGLGAFSVVNFQILEGPQGPPGQDGIDGIDGIDGTDGINGTDGIDGEDGINGTDGQDAPGGFIVRIVDPDHGEPISGIVQIRALVYGSEDYSVSILRNGTELGTSIPWEWNTTKETDGWWNLTVKATDLTTSNQTQDELVVYVYNDQLTYIEYFAIAFDVYGTYQEWEEICGISFNTYFKANIFVVFSGGVQEGSGNQQFHFGFNIDDGDIVMVSYGRIIVGHTDLQYSHIFNNIQPGSHQISFYLYPYIEDASIEVSPGNRLAFLYATIIT